MSYLDGELPLGEVGLLLLLLEGLAGRLELGESPADGTGLLGAEVERRVLLAGVEEAELSPLLGVDDGQGPSNRLAHVVATGAVSYPFSLSRVVGVGGRSEEVFTSW